ncbi:FtsX-like permease family protein [Rhodocytophaga rosea]|uniref:FtsX-like permease family protein n=2 Tax=Rhodocytophaga rosea TaxID=2704465 RepID=A0A6C0GUS1_9BACT|nr:FtsX-like permease family protein [Rhodocytophaga rosea]
MLRNYLTIALRNLQRNKAYTFINVMGLALSITCGILIFTLVKYHLSFDTFHANAGRIYRFVTEQHMDNISYVPNVPNPFGKAFREDYTFAEKAARIATIDGALIALQHGKELKKFKEAEAAFAESEFFDIFNYPLTEGNKSTALTQPNTAIITEKIARKYFGTQNAVNKTFRLNNRIDFTITGILKDLPPNTDRKTEVYLSYSTLKAYDEWLASDDSWGGITGQMQCYTLLKPGVNPADIEKVLPAYVKKYRPTNKNVHHYKLQPLADIHFNAHYGGVMEKRNLWVLSLIGIFLVMTASVNFINLATAQALKRGKEVGVRKVLGGLPTQLFGQFITETGLITLFALVIAYGLSLLALPYMNEWFRSQMTIELFSDKFLAVFMFLLLIVVTLFSGAYPGLILARFQPVLAIKGKLTHRHVGGFPLRRALIVTQFTISQMLIIGVVVIASQMHYSKQSDLGFNKDAVVMIPVASEASDTRTTTLKNQLSRIAGVENVSLCFGAPSSTSHWGTSVKFDNRPEEEVFRINCRAADEQYIPLFDLQLVAGRNLHPSDTVREFIVNETFVRKLNLQSPQEVIGKEIRVNGGNIVAPIVGVVKDFHDQSFHEDINAIFITTLPETYENYAVKINLANVSSTLTTLEKTWSTMHPDHIYEYQFLDEHIAAFYQTEELMLKLIQSFAGIAIFIGCLGLYGLVSFMAVQKVKEIGVRKVLGASAGQIFWLFSREYLPLICIAFLIATPVAHYFMQQWLDDFAYSIPLHVGYYLVALAGSVGIALFSASYQSIKASLANPVKALRNE